MNRDRLSALAHARHPVAAPFSDATVSRLVERAAERAAQSVLDVGCGSGQWLMRLLVLLRGARGVGIDLSRQAIAAAEMHAAACAVTGRADLRRADAATLHDETDRYDALLCIGSTHSLGGLVPTLRTLRRLATDDAVLLLGDGFWERPPDETTLTALGADPDEFPSYAGLVATVEEAGWAVEHVQVSSAAEWDDYEWSWVSTLRRWAHEHPEDPDAADARRFADEHQATWLHGYRGTLGFAAVTAAAR